MSLLKLGFMAVGAILLASAATTVAQVQTETTTTKHQSTKQVKVERGEVVLVDGPRNVKVNHR